VTGVEAGRVSGQPTSVAEALSQAPLRPNESGGLMVGEIKGTLAAVVARADAPKGLTMRSEPSLSGSFVGFVVPGTQVKGPSTYREGWVWIDAPPYHGWVSSANLKAVGGLASISSAHRPENCLPIRSGPSTSFPVVKCAHSADKLVATGFWSNSNWALLQDQGWVYGPEINAASRPVRSVSATRLHYEPY